MMIRSLHFIYLILYIWFKIYKYVIVLICEHSVTQLDAPKDTRDNNNPSITTFIYLLFSFGRRNHMFTSQSFSNKCDFVNWTDPLRNIKITGIVSILVQGSECLPKLSVAWIQSFMLLFMFCVEERDVLWKCGISLDNYRIYQIENEWIWSTGRKMTDRENLSIQSEACRVATLLKLSQTKRRPPYLKTQSVPRCKHFLSRL
jgi:hypothetical protein